MLETFLYDPLVDWSRCDTRVANGNIQVITSKEAWKSRATIKANLTGRMDESGLALSINGQVQRLIVEATSEVNRTQEGSEQYIAHVFVGPQEAKPRGS